MVRCGTVNDTDVTDNVTDNVIDSVTDNVTDNTQIDIDKSNNVTDNVTDNVIDNVTEKEECEINNVTVNVTVNDTVNDTVKCYCKMPIDKNKTRRFQVLDRCFTDQHRMYFVEDLQEACRKALDSFLVLSFVCVA